MTHSTLSPRARTGARAALTAILTTIALALSGCFALPVPPADGPLAGPRKTDVTVHYLYASGSTGGTGEMRIRVAPSEDGEMKVDISETEVSGLGDMMRGAAWNAVTVATVLTGSSLNNAYRFEIHGHVDGPSAGALSTAGVLSLLLGDDLLDGVTMTGTIMPTGAVGPVGGIPQKIQGAIDSGEFTKILIPLGQRNSRDGGGNMVDVVQLGTTGGIEVVEVSNIYEAYRHLTGEELPAPQNAPEPRYDEDARSRLKNATSRELASFDSAANAFLALDPWVQEWGAPIFEQAYDLADDAHRLESQGLQAGAYTAALNANLLMKSVAATFQAVDQTLTAGIPALNRKLDQARTNEAKVMAYLDSLGDYRPTTLTDAEALISAYGNTFDAYALGEFAAAQLDRLIIDANSNAYSTIEELAAASIWPLILFEFAGNIADAADSIFQLGRDNAGATISEDVDLHAIGSFFRRSADANWNAYLVTVVQPHAEYYNVSNDSMLAALANADITVALSYSGNQYIRGLQSYIGDDSPNSAYAAMGYGFLNYARNAILLEKYSPSTHLDDNYNIVGVDNEIILSRSLELAKTQVSRSVAMLVDAGTSPALTIASFEDANVRRERDVSDRFDALESYAGGFISTRMLAYLAGTASEGWRR